ncbi:MAG: 3-ketoacyl-ACP reductase [Bacteroidota bacterium]
MDKTALVTGGTRGIGLGIAEALASASFNLILCGRRPAKAVAPTLAQLALHDVSVDYIQADLGSPEARQRLMSTMRERYPKLDVLVNNAGMAPRERNNILEATEASFEEIIRVNLQGPYFLTQQCARWMIETRKDTTSYRPSIIFVTSISSTVASISRGEYCISKAGLSMANLLWATALAEHGIDVFEIRPGLITTDMTAGVKAKYDEMIGNGLLLESRWGTPADIGKAVRMLVQGDLPYASGQVLTLDGGLTMGRL